MFNIKRFCNTEIITVLEDEEKIQVKKIQIFEDYANGELKVRNGDECHGYGEALSKYSSLSFCSVKVQILCVGVSYASVEYGGKKE